MLRITHSGIIFRNPLPAVQPLQAQFPGLCQVRTNEVICVYKRGSAPAALDCVYAVARSTDGGRIWTDEGVLWDRRSDDRTYSYGYGYPVCLDNGEILLAGYRWDRSESDAEYNIYNPETLGAVPLDAVLFRSLDGGRTWSRPVVIPPPNGVAMANPSGRILQLKDGELLLPLETWKAWADKDPVRQYSLVAFSHDHGQTWKNHVPVARDSHHRILYWNGMFTRLTDGRILVMYWTKDSFTEEDLTVQATYSENEGKTWALPYDTGIAGQMGCAVDAGNGRVLAIYNVRNSARPGIRATLSHDGGRTWSNGVDLELWDARGTDMIGNPEPDNRSQSLYHEGMMAFGKPDVVRLTDNTFLVGFWCMSNAVMHLRYVHIES